jgi:hypothetical protein
MVTENYYQVAGHVFRLSFSDNQSIDLANYEPFCVTDVDDSLFSLSVVDDLPDRGDYKLVGQFDDDIASIGIFKSKDGNFRFQIAYPNGEDYCTMNADADFHIAEVVLPDNSSYRFFCLNNCLMLLYAFASSQHDTLLMHASVIKNAGSGYIFLGKSGTGKSTHSRLWLEHIAGSELLNDDNPVIRIIDGQAMVFGSPWSGKTPCYRNEGIPLCGIVKLRQAPGNRITGLSPLQVYAAVLPSCSCMKWENDIMAGVHSTVEKLVTKVGCHQLACLPDKAAATLCYNTVCQ